MKNFEYYTSPKSNIKEIIPIALEKLNWNYDRNESHYTVKFPINLYTWGSIMDIKIINDSQFNVEVHPKLPTQIFDWGDGKRKIDKLMSTIKEIQ
ncbi:MULTISPECIES: hypothetical protein [Chryseobacterium]|uniref:Uncharacterized protein n=1 Tax=Chryseobacterium gambrini TaxID=373672 RepID=A0AAJ1R6P2_9FLAO|nr:MULTISPECIES: hypothetical protein [Chryseobacterium]MDN4015101.1 hypothetical protein [Chryseobacterium gambrini]QWA37294.1 hypothetical protein KKI44_15315 [Chryseobacterium sp. ZHDP1]